MTNIKKFGVVTAVVALLMGLSIAPSSAETKLRLAGQHPIDHQATIIAKKAIKSIEDAGVDLKIQFFPAGQLGFGEQVFEDVARGTIDIGHTFIYSHNDPLLEINQLPYLVGTYDQMRKVYSPGSNFYRIYEGLLAKQGLKLLGVFAEGFIGVGTAKEPQNATTADDKDVQIRVFAMEVGRLTALEMGFRTVTMNWGDVPTAIQQGVVDGVIGGTAESNFTVMGDVVKYFLPYKTFVENTAFYMNQEKWDSLTADQQKAVADAFTAAASSSFDYSERIDAEYLKRLPEEKDIQVISISDAEIAAIAEHVKNTVWPVMEETFGKEVLDQLKADVQ